MQRLSNLSFVLSPCPIDSASGEQLSLLDHRTGKEVKINVKESKDCYFVDAKDVGKLKDEKGEPLRVYDPGYMNTICNTSRISYIDGDKGVLEYRGIPIEQLAEHSTFLEVAFLLIYGELPTKGQLGSFSDR